MIADILTIYALYPDVVYLTIIVAYLVSVLLGLIGTYANYQEDKDRKKAMVNSLIVISSPISIVVMGVCIVLIWVLTVIIKRLK